METNFKGLKAAIDAANAQLSKFLGHMERLSCSFDLASAIAKEYSPGSLSSDRWYLNTISTKRKVSFFFKTIPEQEKFDKDKNFRDDLLKELIQNALNELNSATSGVEFFIEGDFQYSVPSKNLQFTVNFK